MLNADAFKHKSKTDLRERKTNYSPGGVKERKLEIRKNTDTGRSQSVHGHSRHPG